MPTNEQIFDRDFERAQAEDFYFQRGAQNMINEFKAAMTEVIKARLEQHSEANR